MTLAGNGQNDVGGWARAPATCSPDAGATPLPCIVQLGRADWTPLPSALSQLASCSSPSPSSLSSPCSSSSSSSYQSIPTRCSSRPTLPPLVRSIVTSPQLLLPHALKPSVLTGFFSLPDEHQGESVGRSTSICTGARWIYPLTLADPEGRCRHGIPSGPRPTFDPTWTLLYVAEHLDSETPHSVSIRTTMLVS